MSCVLTIGLYGTAVCFSPASPSEATAGLADQNHWVKCLYRHAAPPGRWVLSMSSARSSTFLMAANFSASE